MKRKLVKLTAPLLALVLLLGTAAPASAAAKSRCLTIRSPKHRAVWYVGESVPVRVSVRSPGKGWSAATGLTLTRGKEEEPLWMDGTAEAPDDYQRNVSTRGWSTGRYTLRAVQLGLPAGGDAADLSALLAGLLAGGKQPTDPAALAPVLGALGQNVRLDRAGVTVTLKTLKAPKKFRVRRGRKKVTLAWKKAAGATRYQVYRSKYRKSGYVRVATVKKTGYIDRRVKRGQRYYYKVRSLRTGHGTVRSGWTRCRLAR